MTYSLAINGAQVKTPASLEVVIQDIDTKASRDSNGLLHRDRVAIKRKLTVKWGPLTVSDCSVILKAISGQFFLAHILTQKRVAWLQKHFIQAIERHLSILLILLHPSMYGRMFQPILLNNKEVRLIC